MVKLPAGKTLTAVSIAFAALAMIGYLVVRETAAKPQGLGESIFGDKAAGSKSAGKYYLLSREFDAPVEYPTAIAIGPDNRVYIGGEGQLAVCDMFGSAKDLIELEDTPYAIAVDNSGLVYAGLTKSVVVIDPFRGSIDTWSELDESAIITSVAVSTDEVLVADAGNRVVLRYDLFGKLLGRIDARFVIPSPYFDVAFDPAGDAWIADTGRHTLAGFDASGAKLDSWGRPGLDANGFGGCCNPIHFVIPSDGGFITSEKGLQRIKVLDAEGRHVSTVAGPRDLGGGAEGLDLAIDKDDTLLVLLAWSRKILVFERNI